MLCDCGMAVSRQLSLLSQSPGLSGLLPASGVCFLPSLASTFDLLIFEPRLSIGVKFVLCGRGAAGSRQLSSLHVAIAQVVGFTARQGCTCAKCGTTAQAAAPHRLLIRAAMVQSGTRYGHACGGTAGGQCQNSSLPQDETHEPTHVLLAQ